MENNREKENFSYTGENSENPERIVARTKEELPPLKEGYARLVHLTSERNAESILRTGLHYEQYGMIQSMATIWTKEEDVEFTSDDPRFKGEHIVAVVIDISYTEVRLHDDIVKSPGVIPPDRIVGILGGRHKEI